MQLRIFILLLLSCFSVFGQEVFQDDSSGHKQYNIGPVDVNFLFSYYNQDGNHSAVTGGIGPEKLEDYATKIIVNVPLDSVSQLSVQSHVNYYTSASTDNINDNVSSASSSDLRAHLEMAYSKTNKKVKRTMRILAGAGIESDYITTSLGTQFSKQSQDMNRQFDLLARAYFDQWRLIFPNELRATAQQYVKTDKRRTFLMAISYSQVFTTRFTGALTCNLVYQKGLLSTPFHRVYFTDDEERIEHLPGHRLKFPAGLRLNYFWGNHLITRFYYRFYYDNFGILGNTLSLEIPIKVRQIFSIQPFYRFHIQQQAEYFKAYGLHELDELYYTSDYDLSAFQSQKFGIGFSYSPGSGTQKIIREKRFRFKLWSVRYAYYIRSDGLKAHIVSTHLSVDM